MSQPSVVTAGPGRDVGPGSAKTREELDRTFSAFVAHRQGALWGFAQVVCGNRAEAEDLVQTALAKAYLQWRRLSADDFNAEAYVRKIIVNDHTGSWRRAWRRREVPTDVMPEPVRPVPERSDEIWAVVQQLPKRQRAVIAMRYLSDLSVADTAAMLNISEGTVKSQTARALASLKRLPPDSEDLT